MPARYFQNNAPVLVAWSNTHISIFRVSAMLHCLDAPYTSVVKLSETCSALSSFRHPASKAATSYHMKNALTPHTQTLSLRFPLCPLRNASKSTFSSPITTLPNVVLKSLHARHKSSTAPRSHALDCLQCAVALMKHRLINTVKDPFTVSRRRNILSSLSPSLRDLCSSKSTRAVRNALVTNLVPSSLNSSSSPKVTYFSYWSASARR